MNIFDIFSNQKYIGSPCFPSNLSIVVIGKLKFHRLEQIGKVVIQQRFQHGPTMLGINNWQGLIFSFSLFSHFNCLFQ
jgi:hypothetical protein